MNYLLDFDMILCCVIYGIMLINNVFKNIYILIKKKNVGINNW